MYLIRASKPGPDAGGLVAGMPLQMRAVNAQSAGCRVIRAAIRMGSTAAGGATSPPIFAGLARGGPAADHRQPARGHRRVQDGPQQLIVRPADIRRHRPAADHLVHPRNSAAWRDQPGRKNRSILSATAHEDRPASVA